jgi:hypothetical protein
MFLQDFKERPAYFKIMLRALSLAVILVVYPKRSLLKVF